MKKTPAISVIVAVYNAEKYIRRCLDSIQGQTFSDFEALLIDDGSTDKSGMICDEYAEKDKRFRVIHKENGGVSSARQCGVDNAVGKYSIHVDPDDWVETDYLEAMLNKITEEDADICFCQYIVEYEKCLKYPPLFKSTSQYFLNPIDELLPIYGTGMCNKLIRQNLYRKHNIKFPKSLSLGEDSYVLVILLLTNPKISIANKYLYHYDRHSNSEALSKATTNTSFFKNRFDYIKLIDELDQPLILSNHRNTMIVTIAHDSFYYNIYNQKEYINHFGKYFFTILTSHVNFHKKINILLSLLGLKWLVHPIYIFMKKKFYTHE